MKERNYMERILLVEDEINIRKIIAYDLKKANYELIECGDGQEALDYALNQHFDLMIIDWMLPSVSGIDIIKILRNKGCDAIIMMLTARDDETDLLTAFDYGVDDYMTKPFSPRELLARVNAHLKRIRKKESYLQLGNVKMDLAKRCAYHQSDLLELTKKEFELLEYFMNHTDRVLSRDNILNDVWGFDYDGDTRIVDVHVSKLRNKLKGSSLYIKSSRGIGYLLEIQNETA